MYAKVFEKIFTSSIATNYATRHVFMDLLVLANIDGDVDMTIDAIARVTNVPQNIIEKAIADLMKPDPKSRTPHKKGRRIVPLDDHRDWGWHIVNYQHYANIRNEEALRKYFRETKRRQRARLSRTSQGRNETKLDSVSVDVDVDAYTEGKSTRKGTKRKNSSECVICGKMECENGKQCDSVARQEIARLKAKGH